MPDEPRGEAGAMPAPPRRVGVFIATDDEALDERVHAALGGDHFQLHSASQWSNDARPPEVIVTDQSLASTALSTFHPMLMRGQIAVVMVGRSLPADVVLPGDFTRRELRLACRLLSQVVTLRRQNHRLEELANIDPLTGLPNRRAFESLFATFVQSGQPVALALLDIDHFKRINAELGYVRGDEVLCAAAKTLTKRARPHFVARLGGDEFVVLWHEAQLDAALTITEQLRPAMGLAAGLKAESPVFVSAGVAIGDSPTTLAHLLSAADTALRRAKHAGGRRTEAAS